MPKEKKTFEELYEEILKHMNDENTEKKLNFLNGNNDEEDEYHLDCILHPEKYAPVLKWEKHSKCFNSCDFDAFEVYDDGFIYF